MGILTRTFNRMANDLGKLYRGLELAVDEKTRKLQHANQTLQVLYDSSKELTASRIHQENFQAILQHQTKSCSKRDRKNEMLDNGRLCYVPMLQYS